MTVLPIPAPDDPDVANHVRISSRHVIPFTALRPDSLVRHGAGCHPRRIRYGAPPLTRALAHLAERPGAVLAEWSALAALGLDEFSDSADTTLLCSSDLRLATVATEPTLRRRTRRHKVLDMTLGGRPVRVTTHLETLAGCLKSLARGEHAWDTLAVLQVDPVTIMSVQLIDRFRRVFGASTDQLRVGLKGTFSAPKLDRYLLLSCGLTDSRPETVLRLLANEAVQDLPEVRFESQVPVYTDGTVGRAGERDPGKTLLTVMDQADPHLRVGLQQDGEHHLERSQRDKDAEITADLLAAGWQILRTSTGMLRTSEPTRRRIRAAATAALEGRRLREGTP